LTEHTANGHTAEAQQRYQEYLDRFPWGEHAQEAQEALERLGGEMRVGERESGRKCERRKEINAVD
jgi:hypothetical protein